MSSQCPCFFYVHGGWSNCRLDRMFRRAKKPVALFVDDAHDLHPKTLIALKRLIELVAEGGGQLSIVLVGHPKLKNDLRRPKMEDVNRQGTGTPIGIQLGPLFAHGASR